MAAPAYGQEPSETYLSQKRRFSDFFHDYQPGRGERYADRLEPLFSDEKRRGVNARLLIDVHDLQQFDDKLHAGLLREPTEALRPCIDAARDAARGLDNGLFGQKHEAEIQVRRSADGLRSKRVKLSGSRAQRQLLRSSCPAVPRFVLTCV